MTKEGNEENKPEGKNKPKIDYHNNKERNFIWGIQRGASVFFSDNIKITAEDSEKEQFLAPSNAKKFFSKFLTSSRFKSALIRWDDDPILSYVWDLYRENEVFFGNFLKSSVNEDFFKRKFSNEFSHEDKLSNPFKIGFFFANVISSCLINKTDSSSLSTSIQISDDKLFLDSKITPDLKIISSEISEIFRFCSILKYLHLWTLAENSKAKFADIKKLLDFLNRGEFMELGMDYQLAKFSFQNGWEAKDITYIEVPATEKKGINGSGESTLYKKEFVVRNVAKEGSFEGKTYSFVVELIDYNLVNPGTSIDGDRQLAHVDPTLFSKDYFLWRHLLTEKKIDSKRWRYFYNKGWDIEEWKSILSENPTNAWKDIIINGSDKKELWKLVEEEEEVSNRTLKLIFKGINVPLFLDPLKNNNEKLETRIKIENLLKKSACIKKYFIDLCEDNKIQDHISFIELFVRDHFDSNNQHHYLVSIKEKLAALEKKISIESKNLNKVEKETASIIKSLELENKKLNLKASHSSALEKKISEITDEKNKLEETIRKLTLENNNLKNKPLENSAKERKNEDDLSKEQTNILPLSDPDEIRKLQNEIIILKSQNGDLQGEIQKKNEQINKKDEEKKLLEENKLKKNSNQEEGNFSLNSLLFAIVTTAIFTAIVSRSISLRKNNKKIV